MGFALQLQVLKNSFVFLSMPKNNKFQNIVHICNQMRVNLLIFYQQRILLAALYYIKHGMDDSTLISKIQFIGKIRAVTKN